MRVAALKAELDERGIAWRGLAFEKQDLVRLLQDARARTDMEVMSNPKAMSLILKAQSSPKFIQALEDMQQNGPSALSKYDSDPDVLALMKDIEDALG